MGVIESTSQKFEIPLENKVNKERIFVVRRDTLFQLWTKELVPFLYRCPSNDGYEMKRGVRRTHEKVRI